jgi:hypothetical protein
MPTRGAARVIRSIADLSFYAEEIGECVVAVLADVERGKPWEPIYCKTLDEFERQCGRTWTRSSDPLVIRTGLMQGANFAVIRLLNCVDPGDKSTCTAKKASLVLNDRGSQSTPARVVAKRGPYAFNKEHGGRFDSNELGPFHIVENVNDKLLLQVSSDVAPQSVTLTAGTSVTADAIASEINAATDKINASVVDGKLRLEASNVADSLIILSVDNDAYSALGVREGVYAPVAGNNVLTLSVDDGADQTFTFPEGAFTSGQVANLLTTLDGAMASSSGGCLVITGVDVGSQHSITIKDCSAAPYLGIDVATYRGYSGTAKDTLRIEAESEGAWGNYLKVSIYENAFDSSLFDMRIAYSNQGGLNEYHSGLTMDHNAPNYVVTVLNAASMLVRVYDLGSTNPDVVRNPRIDEAGTFLTGGDNGLPLTIQDYIGDPVEQTGIWALDKIQNSIDVIVPGTQSVTVLQAIAAYCENGRLMMAHCNTPAGYDPYEAKKWRMGEAPYTHEAFNSHLLTLYFGRPLVYDPRTDKRIFVSNLGHLAAVLTKTTNRSGYSYAPAGFRRGTVDLVEGLDFNLADYPGVHDMMSDAGINALIISREQGLEQAVFWEQFTTQTMSSALRDINVMRFILMMQKTLTPVLYLFLWEPNHPITWREIYRTLKPTFDKWAERMDIYAYQLQMDQDAYFDVNTGELKAAIINSGYDIDQGIYHCRFFIQPTRAIRIIDAVTAVTRTGELFSQYTILKQLPAWWRNV